MLSGKIFGNYFMIIDFYSQMFTYQSEDDQLVDKDQNNDTP